MQTMILPILLTITVLVSLYDLRTQRIPNWVTLPLLIAGLIVHFPGVNETRMASIILMIAFTGKWMGAGDVKLWLALIWAVPFPVSEKVLPVMLATLFVTGLIQLAWRWLEKTPITGISTPAAWRTILFVVVLWYVH